MTRIVEVATARLIRPLHTPFVTALRRTDHVLSVAVRVTDADGTTGYGEAPQIWRVTGESMPGIEECVHAPLAGALLGRELTDDQAAEVHRWLAGAVAANTGARAATEIAVLDLLARRAERSLAATLGATATELGCDLTIAAQVDDPSAELLAPGFTTAKVKVGLDPADVARVIRIQEQSGEGTRIRIDANQAWDVATTVAAVEAWQAAGVGVDLVEQPLPFWDLAGHAELRRRISVPVMLDESVFSVHDLERAIDAEAADLVNIKLAKCGGVHAALDIARLARKAELGVMVGSMMESELGLAAAAALSAVVAPQETHDLDAAWWSIDPDDTGSPYRDGRFVISPTAGLSRAVERIEGSLGPWRVTTA
jgi:L-alanine-DL-glutamate epimerase-like enolase superfamily enzyme